MKQFFFLCVSLLCFLLTNLDLHAEDTVIWTGKVHSNGKPTDSVKLELGQKYRIKVGGEINLGKWWQQRHPLANDACYEFSDLTEPPVRTKFTALKNTFNISVCDGKYHPDHNYESDPFTAAQTGIHFWIYDTNYDDNSGELSVQIIKVGE